MAELYTMIPCYLYLYHLKLMFVLPSVADSVTDNLSANFSQSTPLARSAPIYSYESSGPRTISVQFDLHRDMMKQLNDNLNDIYLEDGEDYVDALIKGVQAAVLPEYNDSAKMVNPPMVALRLGNEIYIKGIVNGSVGVTYKYPIIGSGDKEGKYSTILIGFTVTEVLPFLASLVRSQGSFRGYQGIMRSREKVVWGYALD